MSSARKALCWGVNVGAGLMLAACSLAPTYERPAAPIPDAYPLPGGKADGRSAADMAWKDFFGDARLQALISAALANNRDLRTAALRVEESRALFGIQRADQFPTINGNASYTRTGTTDAQQAAGQPSITRQYQVGLGLTAFELDFFGRVRNLSDAALAQYLATGEARSSAQISLVAQVAQAYFAERSYAEQLELAQRTLEGREQGLSLTRSRFEGGASSQLDLRQVESLAESAHVAVATLKRQLAQAGNALNLLVGAPVADLPPPQGLSGQKLVTDIPPGAPSELLTRRPDIRAAEQRLIAANANIGAARAAFFPRISLTSTVGTVSPELSGLFESGSRVWSFAPQLTLPIFDWGRNSANLDLSKVRNDIAIVAYEQSIQSAFREVSDALVARDALDEQLAAQQRYRDAVADRLALSEARYAGGIDSFLGVLDAQRELFSADQTLLQVRQQRLLNAVDLYRALGGGV